MTISDDELQRMDRRLRIVIDELPHLSELHAHGLLHAIDAGDDPRRDNEFGDPVAVGRVMRRLEEQGGS
ncbi:MAG: hypothetical protein F4169_20925 [Gammaproteobacteria bacterium]|nr:hypothetical protein [Gammaproteobacteria bacterium]